jgi:hypothetical protein
MSPVKCADLESSRLQIPDSPIVATPETTRWLVKNSVAVEKLAPGKMLDKALRRWGTCSQTERFCSDCDTSPVRRFLVEPICEQDGSSSKFRAEIVPLEETAEAGREAAAIIAELVLIAPEIQFSALWVITEPTVPRNQDYMSEHFERWKELASLTSKEQDPAKLTELANEMNLVLTKKTPYLDPPLRKPLE